MKKNINKTLHTSKQAKKKSSRDLGWLLDDCIVFPGGYRIGIDGIIGLIPGVGDALGAGLSTWIIYKAYKQGVSKSVLGRMLFNIIIDLGIGAIPFVGDVFDFFWKANQKNAALLEASQNAPFEDQQRETRSNLIIFIGVLAILATAILGVFLLLYYIGQNV